MARAQGYQAAMDAISDLILIHRYNDAQTRINVLQRQYPNNTELHFQKLVLLFTWIDDYGIADSLNSAFRNQVDVTITAADRDIARNPNDARARFYKGSALAYRSLYRSYVEGVGMNIRSLVNDASAGMDELEKARRADPTFADPLIAIGKYKHWKSKKFPWPFATANDGRQGVRLLEQAVRMGAQAEGGAEQTLGWVYMSERRYDDAIALVRPLISQYPTSRFFLEIAARAYQEKGDYARADEMFGRIMNGFTPVERAHPFVVMKYERWVARLRMQQGRRDEACQIARKLKSWNYAGVHADWLERKLAEVDRIQSEACR
jgi:tetratricopeptide (TPR) repeat protein